MANSQSTKIADNMTVTIKTPEDIEKMREVGRLAAEVLDMIGPYVVPGVSTEELDRICYDHIVIKQKGYPAPLNYKGFPKSICTSINEVVCHGIPSEKKILKKGDIVNIDITVIKSDYEGDDLEKRKNGFHGDTSKMFLVGDVQEHAQKLCQVTQECLYKGLSVIKPGARLGDIGNIIARHAHANNYTVVEEFCGHGIGRVFHEEPQVLHYGPAGTGLIFKPGMTFTVEPMINAGRKNTKVKPDGWTAVTKDKRLSAQWEHTIVVTEQGIEILTLRDEEDIPFTTYTF